MHDFDRQAPTTAARLAALAALRDAQAAGVRQCAVAAAQEAQIADVAVKPAPPGPEISPKVYAAVEAAVQKSRAAFLARLASYHAKLGCMGGCTKSPTAEAECLDNAQIIAHRIAGLGKTLGFADLGETARETEAAITAYRDDASGASREVALAQIAALCAGIEAIGTPEAHSV